GGTATQANYTNYTRGINGIIVDVANRPGQTLTASDFTFRVGNANDLGTFTTAPAPMSITVRPGAGVGGSDRVTILFANNAIKNQWLEVTTLATPATGLGSPDVFYFGNSVADTFNSTAN